MTEHVDGNKWVAQERQESALYEALARFQAENPDVERTHHVSLGKRGYDFAPLAHILKVVRPLLSRHGLSVRWEYSYEEKRVVVTCVLCHEGGGRVRSTLAATPQVQGDRGNVLQAIGAALTYLRRYTLCASIGIEPDQDFDGQSHGDNIAQKGTAGVSPARQAAEEAKAQKRGSQGRENLAPPSRHEDDDDEIPF